MFYGPLPLFLFLGLLGLIAFIALRVMARRRRQQWRQVAAELHCTLLDDTSESWDWIDVFFPQDTTNMDRYPHPLFHRGHKHRAPNVMTGSYEGVPITCFDYHFEEGSGDDSRTYSYMCLLLPAPFAFANLSVRPEQPGSNLLAIFGVEDIQLESDDFNRRFEVKCDDPRFAFDVLHQRCMEFLLRRPDICIEATGSTLLFYQVPRTQTLGGLRGQVQRLLDFGTGFVKLLPEYLVKAGGAR